MPPAAAPALATRPPRTAGRLPLEDLIGADAGATASALDVAPALRALQPRPAATPEEASALLEHPDDAAWERRERRRMVLVASGASLAAVAATGFSLVTALG